MSLAKRIAGSTISQVISKFIIAGLSVISVKLVTNYLGTSGYGEYTVVYELMAFALIMADFGFFHIALREMGKDQSKMSEILGNVMSLRFIISIFATLLTFSVVYFGTDYPLETVKFGMIIASANVVFGLMGTTITAILQVHLKMMYASMVQVIGKFFMVSYIAFAVYADLGFLHTLYAGLFGSILILMLTFFYAHKYSRIYFAFDFALWKKLFMATLPMGIALIFYNIYLRSPIIILDRITHDSHLTGIYGVAQRIIEIIMFIPIALMNSTLPALSDLLHNDKNINAKAKIQNLIQTSFDILNAVCFPTVTGFLVIAPKIVHLISGEDFSQSAGALRAVSFMLIFYFLNTLFIYILIALDRQKYVGITNAVSAVLSVVASLIFIPVLGLYGAVIGHIIPEVSALILAWYFAKKCYDFEIKLKTTLRLVLASAFMGILTYLISDLAIFIVIPLAVLFYLVGLVLFHALPFRQMYLSLFGEIKPFEQKGKKSLKIAFDYRSIYGQKTGKEWYTFSLLKAISEYDHQNHYILYSKYDFDDTNLPENFTKRILRTPLIIWHLHVLFDIVFNKIDIMFQTSSYISAGLARLSRSFKVVLVVHDLVAFLFPASKHSLKAIIIERLTARLAFCRADQIIVPSQNTATDLAREFPQTKDKISIIPEAARESFKPVDNEHQILKTLERYRLPKKYMIFIGTLEPRKNLVRLLHAYSKLSEELKENYPLVIVGKKGWYYKKIFETVITERLEKHVIFTGYIEEIDLPCLLSNATLSIYPSKYEGFGLPLLEAMQCKTAIVSSNTPALLEVASGVAEIADRKSADSIKEAIQTLLLDEKKRNELIQKGIERNKEYSWNKAARSVLAIFRKV